MALLRAPLPVPPDYLEAYLKAERERLGVSATGRDMGWREWDDEQGHTWIAEWNSEGVVVIDLTVARKVVG